VVGIEAIEHRVFVVVHTSLRLKIPATASVGRDRIERVVKDRTAAAASNPATNTLDDSFIRNFNGKDMADISEFAQGFCLWHRAWKTIKHHAINRIRFLNALLDERKNHFVRNQSAFVHVALGFQAHLRAGFDGGTKHVAGGYLGKAGVFHDALCLSAFACTWRTEQDNAAHGFGRVSSLSTFIIGFAGPAIRDRSAATAPWSNPLEDRWAVAEVLGEVARAGLPAEQPWVGAAVVGLSRPREAGRQVACLREEALLEELLLAASLTEVDPRARLQGRRATPSIA